MSENKIVFDLKKAKDLDLANATLLNKKIIELPIADSIIIPAYANLLINGADFIIYSQKTYQIFRFNSEGNYINNIGRRGGGPDEFTEMRDVLINDNFIEILDHNAILKYQPNGEFIKKNNIDYPAFSFAKKDNNYWFYIGNNSSFSKFKLIETNSNFTKKSEHLPIIKKGVPLIEINFNENYYTTFCESLNQKLYRIDNGLINSYYIEFGKLEIPEAILSSDPMLMIDKLNEIEYATIRAYMENKNYTFLLIMKYDPNKMYPELFYWIINKDNNEEKLIRVKDFVEDSYLLFPQMITNNNTIYFLGYDIINVDEQVDQNKNPSIIEIGIDEFFNYGK